MDKDNLIIQTVYQGKWLQFKTVQFMIRGETSVWEMIERTPREGCSNGGVEVIPIIKRTGQKDQLIIIASYRVPLQKFILEFPAGILDDHDVQENGLRELKEETGYTATKIISLRDQRTYGDPWKSNENAHFMIVEVDGDQAENKNPLQKLETSEDIRVHQVDLDDRLTDALQQLAQQNGYEIQSGLWSFALGMGLQQMMKQS